MSDPRQVETLEELRKLVGKRVLVDIDDEDGHDLFRGELRRVLERGYFVIWNGAHELTFSLEWQGLEVLADD